MRFLSSELIERFIDNEGTIKTEHLQEYAVCPACTSSRIAFLFRKNFFGLWRCRQCGFVFANPRPAEKELLGLYTSLSYFRNRTELFEIPRIEAGLSFDVTMDTEAWYGSVARCVTRYATGGTLLDVGGGSGRFLKFIKDNHPEFTPTLLEVNASLCRVARERFGIEAVSGTIEELVTSGRKFDVVVSIATIEHVFDPASYVATIRSVMSDDGVLFMTMPRLGRLTQRFSRAAAYDVAPPVHLNFFDTPSLRAMIETKGIALTILDAFQSHGPVFHLGHVLCKHNYLVEDVVVEQKHEVPGRCYAYRDTSRRTTVLCTVLDRATSVLAPVIQLLDGQRVRQIVLRAT
jgi:SAM-dependent methyltransferase